MTTKASVSPVWVICTVGESEDAWHSVLGNIDPKTAGMQVAQRLCDQRLVEFIHSEQTVTFGEANSDCKNCVRIRKLMVEFARPVEKEKEKVCRPNGKKK